MRLTDIAIGQTYAAVLYVPSGNQSLATRPSALAALPVVIKAEVLALGRRTDAADKRRSPVCRIVDWVGDFDGLPVSPHWLPLQPEVRDRWLVKSKCLLCSWQHYETVVQRHATSKSLGVGLAESIATLTGGTANYDPHKVRVVVSLPLEQASELAQRLTTTTKPREGRRA